jgi:hypothetical protein
MDTEVLTGHDIVAYFTPSWRLLWPLTLIASDVFNFRGSLGTRKAPIYTHNRTLVLILNLVNYAQLTLPATRKLVLVRIPYATQSVSRLVVPSAAWQIMAYRMSSTMYACWMVVTWSMLGRSVFAQWIGRPTTCIELSALLPSVQSEQTPRTDGHYPPTVWQ